MSNECLKEVTKLPKVTKMCYLTLVTLVHFRTF
jgi:hypothetical protein